MAALATHKMREIVQGLSTTSEKIRALDKAGFERADIARFLDKRYQHVRNVLVGPAPKAKTQSLKHDGSSSLKARIQIGAGGRIVIPAEIRNAMNVAEGDTLTARVIDGELQLFSQEAAIRKVQAMVSRYVPESVNLADELIADRREEARREIAG